MADQLEHALKAVLDILADIRYQEWPPLDLDADRMDKVLRNGEQALAAAKRQRLKKKAEMEDAEFAIGVFQVASTSPNVTPKRKQWCRRQIEEYQRRLNELRGDP